MDGQTQIPEALMGAMLIEQGAQKGQFQPVTRDGQPTVASRLMQQATPQPMGVGQAMEQAGLAAQIQAMQAQQAQQALMQQAMAQQRPQMLAGGGIAGLRADIDGFADGGIVGYAVAGDVDEQQAIDIGAEFGGSASSSDEIRLRVPGPRGERMMTPAEMRNEGYPETYIQGRLEREGFVSRPAAQAAPAAASSKPQPQAASQTESQPQPQASALAKTPLNIPSGRTYSAESPSAGMFNAARARLGMMATEPVSPQQGIEASLAIREANDAYRRRLGMLTEMEEIKRQEDESRAFTAERQQMLDRRRQEAADKRQSEQLGRFLRGARGRTLGETLGAAEAAREAFDVGMLNQIRGFEDLNLQIKGLQIEKQNALNKMRNDIATGDFKSAMDSKQKAQNAQNELLKAYAEIDLAQGKSLSQEASARMQATVQPGETERMMAEHQRLLRVDPTGKAAQEYMDNALAFKGAGRRVPPQEARQRLLENYADNWEKMDFMEKKELQSKGIKTYEDYVKYRDRVAGVAPSQSTGSGGPAVGTIMDGYRFKGGNPADKNNWEKV